MIAKERAKRVRFNLRATNNGRIRLSIFKSLKHIHVQAISDEESRTIASASTNSKDFKKAEMSNLSYAMKAEWIGKDVAKKLDDLGVKAVYLDRGPYKYHGVIKVFAEAARNCGLDF